MKPEIMLQEWLSSQKGPVFLGEITILPGYELRHREEVDTPELDLTPLADFAALREWIKYDRQGHFRPVRAHRGLKTGWRMGPLTLLELERALNWIYPNAVAIHQRIDSGTLRITSFRETAARQTGMYRITQIITPEQFEETMNRACNRLCLRERLWNLEGTCPPRVEGLAEGEKRLYCPEACNYLTGQARATIKGESATH